MFCTVCRHKLLHISLSPQRRTFVFLLPRPARLTKFAVAHVRQTCHPSDVILVPRARRFLVTWLGNEGLPLVGYKLSQVALGTRMIRCQHREVKNKRGIKPVDVT